MSQRRRSTGSGRPDCECPHRRFFTWWRVLAVLVAAAMVVSTALYLRGPDQVRRLFYPLSYQQEIAQAASDHQINPYLLAAVIECESGWNPDAVSGAGAVGLMQMLPDTARQVAQMGLVDSDAYPVSELASPEVNIQYGAAYLRYLIDYYDEVEHAVAAYNAGIGTVDAWTQGGGNIRDEVQYPETSHYLLRVVRAREAYAQLYPDAFPGWSS